MIDVVAAILTKEDRILIAKRKEDKNQGELWEFPGGKVEPGEKPQESLVRELKEEMEIEVAVKEHIADSLYDYDNIKIRLIAFKAEILSGDIILNDHSEYRWILLSETDNFIFAPADIPIVEELKN
ncbi:(deoxy)nucleoside triphosphate pyrophosphohydrolase [Clostridium sp.]|uniref:(deoxy)nucleoside triphosphate pyrophosphohydrolase n=1 Tax=Clostridium sp. TaxID=1506 RepID=UPI00284C6253|nr:(deoxy)nucleoside triphosphate pyrophosphohydrolase [Clostridium sp.]MDR3598571.1 (deoxy)nucleoside triphosphate pyrophosphohydrolase [Clostridium sp.]